MYLAVSESIKMNSNIRVEIINTIPGKKEFKAVLDSIENGMKDSFKMISEEDLEKFRKLHTANENLQPFCAEYSNTKDELVMKIEAEKEIDNFILNEKERIRRKNKKEINVLTYDLERTQKGYFYHLGSFDSDRILPFILTLGISALKDKLSKKIRGKIYESKLSAIKKEADNELEPIIEKSNKDLNQIKTEMNLLIEKLNSIIPKNLTNEVEANENLISENYKNLENYIDLDLLASAVSTQNDEK
jgi:hypothetical protein